MTVKQGQILLFGMLMVVFVVFPLLGATSPDTDTQLKREEIRQLSRIADALEKIAGTRR